MANEMIDIHGKIKYIHAVNLNKYSKWSVTIYPTENDMKVIRKLREEGLKNTIQRDDEGADYISFHREPTKSMRGKVVAFAAPRVVDKAGMPMDGSKIGWGSDVTIRLEVYRSTPKSIYTYVAARWDSVRVDNLIEFNAEKQWTPEEQAAVESLKNAKEPDPW